MQDCKTEQAARIELGGCSSRFRPDAARSRMQLWGQLFEQYMTIADLDVSTLASYRAHDPPGLGNVVTLLRPMIPRPSPRSSWPPG